MKKALVLSLVMVLGLGVASFAQNLGGSWDTTITIDPTLTAHPPIGISSELIVTYEVSGWSFTSDTTLTEAGWTGQAFVVAGSLGAFTLGSTLTFDPAGGLLNPLDFFASWVVTGSLSLAGVSFDATFASALHDVMLELKASGSAGLVDVGAVVTFGSLYIDASGDWKSHDQSFVCDFDWYGVDITVDFPFSCAVVASTISFDCAGFAYVKFEIEGIAVPTLPWLTLDATLMFLTQTKTLTLTPVIDFGPTLCFDLYLDMDGMASVLPGHIGNTNGLIWIQGIGIEVEFGGVVFTGISFWDPGVANDDKPGLLAGTAYWEAYQISTSKDGCCGGVFDFSVGIFFSETSLNLFDVSFVQADVSVNVTSNFVFSTGISVDLDAVGGAFTLWTIGFAVTW